MFAKQALQGTLKRWTGVGRPSKREVDGRIMERKARASRFQDDGLIPNNPDLDFIHYRSVVRLQGSDDPAAVFEVLFEKNGWVGLWRNGIYDYVHYHPRTHEVLGLAAGKARVQFGGPKGKVLALKAGDVVVLPAGTGHQALSASKDLVVVGAYPAKGKYDEYESSLEEHGRALRMISKVPLPPKDPVYGAEGGLRSIWSSPHKRAKSSV
jgi:uncharacterized protein YjlB